MKKASHGFTLIELLVALTIVGLLLSIVAPRYFGGVTKAEEAVLKENLYLVRDALDKYHGDTGHYPDSLDDLVSKKYLRALPVDPITRSSKTWLAVPPADPQEGAVCDVKSGATGIARDGEHYGDW